MTVTDHDVSLPLGIWRIDPVHSTVGFEVRDMAHLFATVRGRFTDYDGVVEVTPVGARASGAVRVKSLTTDHGERDENLRSGQFLDASASPEMRFETECFGVAADGTVHLTGRLELRARPATSSSTAACSGRASTTRERSGSRSRSRARSRSAPCR